MYENATQFNQQAVNSQQATNQARKTRFQGQAQQGQYPYAQQGSQQAQATGAASQGAQQGNAQRAQPPAQPQPTFAQMQQQGMARPAPPAPAPTPMAQGNRGGAGTMDQGYQQWLQMTGQSAPQQAAPQTPQGAMQGLQQMFVGGPQTPAGLDPQAIAADPQGFAQWQQQAAAAGYGPQGQPLGQQVQPTGNSVPFSGTGQQPGQMSPAFGAAGGQTGLPSNVNQALQQLLANPSAYNTDAVMGTYQRLAGQIDDEFNQRNVGINEEMARRGIYDSTIAGGRLADSNVARRSAQVELGDRLAQQQAERFDQARQQAIALGLTDQGQQFQNSQFSQRLGLDADQFNRDLSQRDRQFGANFDQRQYEFDANLGYQYNDLNQRGMADFLRLLGTDVVDYAGEGVNPSVTYYGGSDTLPVLR